MSSNSLPIRANNRLSARRNWWGYCFIAPAILGIMILNVYPIVFSLITSLHEWDVITPMKSIGLDNYKRMFSDELIGVSLSVTLRYTMMAVPLINITALFIALILNQDIRGRSVFRTICYIPSIVPAVANAALWMYIFNPMYGAANEVMKLLGLARQNWIYDKNLVLPCMAIVAAWGCGNTAIIYLAGLQGVPRHLYEAVEIDGGGAASKFLHITLPMLSPVIFYNIVTGVIGSMQTFTQGYIMTSGGPQNASLFYVLLLYRRAFKNMNMGYACAMAWLLFIIISALTLFNFVVSRKWVYAEGEV
ncbi:MAG: carbohydrate ABC transporter permease [Christensenellales bacterium]|jgi:multiple sugar transport system permease protein